MYMMRKSRQARLVGQKIRQIRKSRRLTQMELAGKIGVQQSDLSRMEKGEYRVSLDSLFRILQVFEMSMGEFFNEVTGRGGNGEDQRFITELHSLDPDERRDVMQFIQFKKMNKENQPGYEDD